MSEVSDLLLRSRESHVAYRESLPRRVASGSRTVAVPGDADAAAVHLVSACRLRAEAHVLDPEQADPAWAGEPVNYPHDALLTFYVEQLSR